MVRTQLSRRKMLGLSAAAAVAAGFGLPSASRAQTRARDRALRLAHLTDLHIQPERRAAEGVAACLAHVQSHAKPDLILTGGDLIMDGFGSDEARTRLQWDLLRTTFADHCSTPVRHCLGNHDIWGWHKKDSGTTGSESRWGKKWALDQLGLAKPWYSFTQAGWRIIVLDSVSPDPRDPNGYVGALGEEQAHWLAAELSAAGDSPVLVVSHIPILTATVVLGEPKKETGRREVSSGLLHADGGAIRDLFAKHRNVRLCLSGHMHRIDRVDYRSVTYLCNGAVSGNWWKGRHHECSEGYAVVDLFDDGTFESQYATYGWKAG